MKNNGTYTSDEAAGVLRRLAEAFDRAGHALYLVGGSVRDKLMGRPDNDLDCTTDAVPAETKRLILETRPAGVYSVGEKFGTIGAVYPGDLRVEITTFRGEEYTAGSRKPSVDFRVGLHEDLARRDFTVNAIAQDILTGALVDPFGGRDDLADGLLRAVGDPAQRFAEDPLRLLRAVRFETERGFTIEPATEEAIRHNAAALHSISAERVNEELSRILLAPDAPKGIERLCDLGLMDYIIPEVMEMRNIDQGPHHHKDVFAHVLLVLGKVPPVLDLRLAALLHDIAKPRTRSFGDGSVHFFGHDHLGSRLARQILQRLRYGKETIDRVTHLVRFHMRLNTYEEEWSDGAVRRFIREAGDYRDDMFTLSRADITSHRPVRVEAALNHLARFEARCKEIITLDGTPRLESPLDGNELMALFGRPPGKWIGVVKDYLLELVLDGELGQHDQERASALAREYLAQHPEV